MKKLLAALLTMALAACGGGGDTPPPPPPPPPAPPTAPSGLTATPAPTEIHLAWVDTSTNETGFDVERADDVAGAPGTYAALPDLAANSTGMNDTGLVAGVNYWYHVRAFNADGASAWIEVGPAAATPAAPSGELVAGFGVSGVVTANGDFRVIDMASDATYLYIVGYNGYTDTSWRIEKRSKSTGALDTNFDGDGIVTVNVTGANIIEIPRAITVDATSMYVGGVGGTYWRIEKRSLATGALDTAFDGDGVVTVGSSAPAQYDVNGVRDMAVDATYLYTFGTEGTAYWRMEKRDKTTGALVAGFGTGGVISFFTGSQAFSMVIDGTSLYAGGLGGGWRIQKRSLATGALDAGFGVSGEVLAALTFPAGPHAMAIDGGSLYLSGDNNNAWRIEKRSAATGALDAAFDGDGVVDVSTSGSPSGISYGIAVSGDDLYAIGLDYVVSNGQWRIEKRSASTGALVTAFDVDGVIQEDLGLGTDTAQAIVIDASAIYVAGYQSDFASQGLRIEKRTR